MRCLSFLLVPPVLLVAGAASAQIEVGTRPTEPRYYGPRAAQPPPTAWDVSGLSGIEVEVRGGFLAPDPASPVQAPNLYGAGVVGDPTGDILRGTEHPYGYDPFGFDIAVGERFLPWLSAGVSFSYAVFNVKDGTDTGDYKDTTSQLQRHRWTLGAYGRYYLTTLDSRLHPWVELGFGYANDTASFARIATQSATGSAELSQYYLSEKGLAVPLTVGLDWRLAPLFSLGPAIGYERVLPLQGCVEVQVDAKSPVPGTPNTCTSPPVTSSGYGVFFGGIFLKVTIGLPTR